MFSVFMEGVTGVANSGLTSTISASATTIPVVSTSGFLPSGFVIISDEDVCYSSITATTFVVPSTGDGRGCHETVAAEHKSGALVYIEGMGFLNRLVAQREYDVDADDSLLGRLKGRFSFLAVGGSWAATAGQMVVWDYPYLNDGLGVYVKMFFYVLSAGMVLMFFRLLLGR